MRQLSAKMKGSSAEPAAKYTKRRGWFACLMAAKWAIIRKTIAYIGKPPGCYERSAASGPAWNIWIRWARKGARKLARRYESKC